MILNLDPSFNPLGSENTIDFQSFIFSGGEPHIKIISDLQHVNTVTVTHRIRNFQDFGLFLIAIDALQHLRVPKLKAIIPYFPAARQDRLMIPGEALSVKVYSEIINNLNLEDIIVFDPHSEVTPALLNNCTVLDNYSFIEKIIKTLPNNTILISPDGGALKKIYKVAAYLQNYDVVEGSKKRNVKTGKLSGFQVYSEDLQGRDCLIVDDICDGGGTFIGLAKELKAKNAGRLYLAVSHGIFNKGFESLNEFFEIIYTTDSFQNFPETKQLQQINISTLLKH